HRIQTLPSQQPDRVCPACRSDSISCLGPGGHPTDGSSKLFSTTAWGPSPVYSSKYQLELSQDRLTGAPLPWLPAQPLLLPHKPHADLPPAETSQSQPVPQAALHSVPGEYLLCL
uniref:Uncharacterized protein n=1 Tax=Chrysemys picta bellii TaxID=8478 RepID=A0A8C3I9T2_CHRPI